MKKISTWLMIAGLILIMIPIAGRTYLHWEQQRLLRQLQAEQQTGHDGQEEPEASEGPAIMDDGFQDEVEQPDAAASPNPKIQENVIGTIRIPSIKSDLLLLDGSSTRQLRYGAGHVSGTAAPGQPGNCAVAGHRNYTFGTYFSRLDEVKPGDQVFIEYGGNTYTYTVLESFTVLPSDTWVLDQPEKERQLTLITCAPKGSNTHRLIVRAGLDGDGDPSPGSEDGERPKEAVPGEQDIPEDASGTPATTYGAAKPTEREE